MNSIGNKDNHDRLDLFKEEGSFSSCDLLERISCSWQSSTKPYILTNEAYLEKTAEHLSGIPKKRRALHVGFSCWYNFDLIVARDSDVAILADISGRVHEVYEHTARLIQFHDNPEDFVDSFYYGLGTPTNYFRESPGNAWFRLKQELQRKESWLSPEGFKKIKTLYQQNRIFHLKLNITDEEAFASIASWIRINGLSLDTLYLSNIGDWLSYDIEELEAMHHSVHRILSDDTIVIDSSEDPVDHRLVQQIFTGKEYTPYLVRKKSV